MTVPDAVVAAVVEALPDAFLFVNHEDTPFDADDIVVFDGMVPPVPPDRYVVVYADTGTLAALAVCGQSDSATFRWQTTSVASDAPRARWLAGRVKAGIVDTRLDVDDWACGPVRHNFESMPARDELVMERPVSYIVDQFALLATRVSVPQP